MVVTFFQHARTVFRAHHAALRARSLGGLRSVASMCGRRAPRRRLAPSRRMSLGRRLRASHAPRTFRALAGHRSQG
jgi:hypothetical protein